MATGTGCGHVSGVGRARIAVALECSWLSDEGMIDVDRSTITGAYELAMASVAIGYVVTTRGSPPAGRTSTIGSSATIDSPASMDSPWCSGSCCAIRT